jgi:hypothetical protein
MVLAEVVRAWPTSGERLIAQEASTTRMRAPWSFFGAAASVRLPARVPRGTRKISGRWRARSAKRSMHVGASRRVSSLNQMLAHSLTRVCSPLLGSATSVGHVMRA